MRSFRFVSLVVLVALMSPSLFARICHPQQPITCGVVSRSTPAAVQTVTPAAKPVIKTAKRHVPATQQSIACGPLLPTVPYFAPTTIAECAPATTHEHSMACGPWLPTVPYCATRTISEFTPATTEEHPMACGPWLPSFPYCSVKTLG